MMNKRLTVYAVMRGTILNSLYESEDHAQWKCDMLNRELSRNPRIRNFYTVVAMPIHKDVRAD